MSTLACIRCCERKVRCDKLNPCSACTRHKVQCIFRTPKPSRRKRNPENEEVMNKRLRHYEALLRQQGIDPKESTSGLDAEIHHKSSVLEDPEAAQQLPTASTLLLSHAAAFKPQLLHRSTGTEMVDNSLWLRVAEEIHDEEDAVEDYPENCSTEGEITNDDDDDDDDFAYILGCKSPVAARLHPKARIIRVLWQTYIEHVNPLTKLVHVPSLDLAIEKAIKNIEQVPRGFEALMFAIYSMAILSLTDEECRETQGENRSILLSRYVAATKAALLHARFMSSTSIVVLQALVLHILSIRDSHEPRAVWSLTAVAIRVAEGMGMHLDGTLLGLPPFECEIRRRIWWQLLMHDFRAAELCGQAKFRGFKLDETTPRKPANINDSEWYPAMPQAAVESTRATEMIWFMLRSELVTFADSQKGRMHKRGKDMAMSDESSAMKISKEMMDLFIKEFEDTIETKYLRFCDPSQPLQLMVLLGARVSTNLIRFMAHHPRRWAHLDQIPASERVLVWNIVVQLLEQYTMMQSTPQLRRFAWSVPYSIQWHAVIHLLDTLRIDPFHMEAAKAWRLIDSLYENNAGILLTINKPIFMVIGNICLEAFNSREIALVKKKEAIVDPPAYISKLRELREAAKSRRGAAIAKGNTKEARGNRTGVSTTDGGAASLGSDPRLGDGDASAQFQPHVLGNRATNPAQGYTRTEDDAFWLSDALDSSLFAGEAGDMLRLDTDLAPPQDYWLDIPGGEVFDWSQWDVWLGNADPGRSNTSAGPPGAGLA